MQLIVRACACACAVAALAGCGGCSSHLLSGDDSCAASQPYQAAVAAAPLHAAEGLPAANTKNALKVPDVAGERKPHRTGESCLDRPPAFYADRPKPAAPK
jgi:uncharacterized lipoprotein